MITDYLGTLCFGLAVIHTFLVKRFQHIALKFRPGSVLENFFHLIGEVEVVFGLWAGIYLSLLTTIEGSAFAIQYLESRHFLEPAFVFVIMVVCSSKPVLALAEVAIDWISKVLPFKRALSFYATTLIVGPLL